MKIYLTSFLLILTLNSFGQASLSGKVTDADTGEPILFGTVVLYKNDTLVTGTQTDFDGNYYLNDLETGIYDIVFSYIGYEKVKVAAMTLVVGENKHLDEVLSSGIELETVVVSGLKTSTSCILRGVCGGKTIAPKGIEKDNTKIKATVKYPEIQVYPNPASSHFTIKSDREIKDASIFNLAGQLVKTLNKGQIQVDVSDLIAGTYFLVIVDNGAVQTEKIVITRN